MHKIHLGQAPLYMPNVIPPSRHLTTGRTLRNAVDTVGIFARTETFKSYFYTHSIPEYNKLDIFVRLYPSVGNISEKRSWYYVGNCKTSIIIAKLRTKCSALSGHLYDLNIINSSNCSCGHDFEDNYHYLFECPLFIVEREIMFTKLNLLNINITLNML